MKASKPPPPPRVPAGHPSGAGGQFTPAPPEGPGDRTQAGRFKHGVWVPSRLAVPDSAFLPKGSLPPGFK